MSEGYSGNLLRSELMEKLLLLNEHFKRRHSREMFLDVFGQTRRELIIGHICDIRDLRKSMSLLGLQDVKMLYK